MINNFVKVSSHLFWQVSSRGNWAILQPYGIRLHNPSIYEFLTTVYQLLSNLGPKNSGCCCQVVVVHRQLCNKSSKWDLKMVVVIDRSLYLKIVVAVDKLSLTQVWQHIFRRAGAKFSRSGREEDTYHGGQVLISWTNQFFFCLFVTSNQHF